MRQLLHIPIIHSETDMGSAATELTRRSAALSGEHRWNLHQTTAGRFWRSIRDFAFSLDVPRLKVYQDGLPADGEAGRRIVAEAARRGSPNYRLVLELLQHGAELRKTEDPAMLLKERENILANAGTEVRSEHYRRRRNRLMEARDRFIAATINATLKNSEIGVLFIGAEHDVPRHLADDIHVTMVKESREVQAYFVELLLGQDDERLKELAKSLTEPAKKTRE